MNMRNRLLAILLGTVTMISVLSGCGKNSGSGSTHIAPADGGASESGVTGQISTASGESEAEASEGIESEAAASAIEERRAEAENSGTYKKVVYALYTWTGKPAGTQRVQDAMNEILRDKLALEVELLPMDFASYAQNIRMMLSAGEQIDIFGINPLGYSQTVNDGYLIDLEEDGLLDKYGQGIKSCLPEKYIDALRINGTLYSLAPVKDFAIEPRPIASAGNILTASAMITAPKMMSRGSSTPPAMRSPRYLKVCTENSQTNMSLPSVPTPLDKDPSLTPSAETGLAF